MFQKFILFFLIVERLFAGMTAFETLPKSNGEYFDKIKILDVKELEFNKPKVNELSGLEYKNGYLYALSDKGYLVVFKIEINRGKIEKLTIVHKYILRKKNAVLQSHDSEGLAFMGKNLLISFERKHRIDLYSLKGVKISKMRINKYLRDKEHYRSKNKGLEGVAYNKKYGIVTAPEDILKNEDNRYHVLYSNLQRFKFKAKGNITGLEFIDKNNILVLLRKFHYLTRERETSLVRVDLSNCNKKHICHSEVLAAFRSEDGFEIDNFEGVTKVSTNRFLMISDDNDSFFQKTLLVLFEIRH